MVVRRVLPGLIVLALLVIFVPATEPANAAQSGLPCEVNTIPDGDLASAAFGLTRPELDALYGPGEAMQSGWYYDFGDFGLILADCDIILDIDPDGQFADPDAARELTRTLLPEDAVLAGDWQFGTIQTSPQDGEEWVSAELAARYRLLGEPRTGSVLILYTYDGDAFNPGDVALIEMRSALIPE
jgi:hypothetical protein